MVVFFSHFTREQPVLLFNSIIYSVRKKGGFYYVLAKKDILVPTDFSVYADNALKQAIDIAKQNKSKIYCFT